MKTIIKATNIDLTDAIRDYADNKISALEKYYAKIMEARIEVELTTHHHKKGKIFRCEVNMKVPGELLRVEKVAANLYKAIDKVRDHLRNELSRLKEKTVDKKKKESIKKQ